MRSWVRSTTGREYKEKQKGRTKARVRAIEVLISEHPEDWQRIFAYSLDYQERIDNVPHGTYGRRP